MTLLLDSNALLWLMAGDSALGPHARGQIERETRLCVSDMSLFEIAIKAARGKIQSPRGLGDVTTQLGIERIGVGDNYLDAMRELPFHHNDPFDRYLIAQSLVDGIPIVTADRRFVEYGARVINARE